MVLAAAAGPAPVNDILTVTDGVIGLAWLIPVLPALGFVLVLVAQRWLAARAAYLGIGAAVAAFGLSVAVAWQVIAAPATYLRPLPRWIEVGTLSVGFDLLIDQLTVVMLLVVTGVGPRDQTPEGTRSAPGEHIPYQPGVAACEKSSDDSWFVV